MALIYIVVISWFPVLSASGRSHTLEDFGSSFLKGMYSFRVWYTEI